MNTVQTSKRKEADFAFIKRHVMSEYKIGDRLPSEQELSGALGTSCYAAIRALKELAEEGHIIRKTRKGTFMASKRPLPKVTNGLSVIAFVADELKYFSEIVAGIEEYYRETNLNIGLVSSDYNSELEITHLRSLQRTGFAGAIIRLSEHDSSVEAIRELFDSGFPVVTIENQDYQRDIPCVQMANDEAAYDATKYLIELGHRRIAHITYAGTIANKVQAIAEREAGYRRALSEAGISIREEYITRVTNYNDEIVPPSVACSTGPGYGYDMVHKLLCLSPPPTAIVSGSHWLGIPSIRAIHDHGLKVPADVSVIEMGDSQAAEHCIVPLTVMKDPKEDIGLTAADLMKRIVEGHEVSNKVVKISAKLVIRESTSPHKELIIKK